MTGTAKGTNWKKTVIPLSLDRWLSTNFMSNAERLRNPVATALLHRTSLLVRIFNDFGVSDSMEKAVQKAQSLWHRPETMMS